MSDLLITPATSKTENKISTKWKMKDIGYIAIATGPNIIFILGWLWAFWLSPAFYVLLAFHILLGAVLVIWGLKGMTKNSLNRKNYEVWWKRITGEGRSKIITRSSLPNVFNITSIKSKDGVIVKNEPTGQRFWKMYKIIGRDLSLVKENDIQSLVGGLEEAFKILKNSIKLLFIDEEIDLNAPIEHLDEQIQAHPKDEQANFALDKIKNLIQKSISTQADAIERTYYLVLQANTEKELIQYDGFLNRFSDGANILLEELKEELDILHVFNNVYAGAHCPTRLFSDEFEDFYDHHTTTNVLAHKDYYEHQGRFHCIFDVYSYPSLNDYGYMKDLTNIEGTTAIVDIIPIQKHIAKDLVNQLKIKTGANAEFVKGAYETTEYSVIESRINEKIQNIAAGDLNLLWVHTALILHADTLEELNDLKRVVKDNLLGKGYELNTFDYQQKVAFEKMMRFNNALEKTFLFNEISNDVLAGFLPFSSLMFNDPTGVFLGVDKSNQTPIFLDLRVTDEKHKRNNGNFVMTASSGGGKSYLASWCILNWTAQRKRVILFDALKDFWGFQKYFDFKMLDVCDGQTSRINIWQCFDHKVKLDGHVSEVINRFIIFKPAIVNLVAPLQKFIYAFFQAQKKIKYKDNLFDLANMQHTDWPTSTHFNNFVKDFSSSMLKQLDIDEREAKDCRNFAYELARGKAGELWNGATTIDLINEDNIIIDTGRANLLSNNIRDLQFFMIFQFILNGLWLTSTQNKGTDRFERKWTFVVADEAHRYVNANNPIALENFTKLAKEIRHFDGTLGTITQEMADFQHVGQSVLKNAIYRIIKPMSDTDFIAYEKMIGEGEITESEEEIIRHKMTNRELLLGIANNMKLWIQMPNLQEVELFWKNERKPNDN